MPNDTDPHNTGSSAPRPSVFDELGGNAILLAMLILLLVVVPFLSSEVSAHGSEGTINRIIWTALIIAGIFRTTGRRHFLWAALVIAIPSLLSRWIDVFGLADAGPVIIALFFALIAGHILTDIFSQRRIGLDHILGGINVYLLLGFLFTRLHVAVEAYDGKAYLLGDVPIRVAAQSMGQQVEHLMQYFSFTTLTTLGYGDIRPMSEIARTLSTAEAISGQLFVAILIARLVSMYVSHPPRD